jgi:hypothetical protein
VLGRDGDSVFAMSRENGSFSARLGSGTFVYIDNQTGESFTVSAEQLSVSQDERFVYLRPTGSSLGVWGRGTTEEEIMENLANRLGIRSATRPMTRHRIREEVG